MIDGTVVLVMSCMSIDLQAQWMNTLLNHLVLSGLSSKPRNQSPSPVLLTITLPKLLVEILGAEYKQKQKAASLVDLCHQVNYLSTLAPVTCYEHFLKDLMIIAG